MRRKERCMYVVYTDNAENRDDERHVCSTHRSTIRIDWAAYPHYTAPERFSPYILDGKHLYYINAFENAASAIETAAVSAQNVARLVLSRLSDGPSPTRPKQSGDGQEEVPVDDL